MATNETLNVILRLTTGDYKKQAAEAARATSQIGDAAKGSTGGVSSLTGGLKLVGGAIAAIGVTRIVGEFRDMAQAAAEDAQSQEILANALRTNTAATDDQIAANERWITSMQVATNTADTDLRQAITDLTVVGRDLEQAQLDIGIAADIAASRGIELGAVIKALVRAQASGSTGGLARLGIETKNAAGEMLTYDQVLQNAAKTMGGTAARAAGTLAGALERGKIAMEEAKEEAGANLTPVLVELTDMFNQLAVGVLGGNVQLAALQSLFDSLIVHGIDPLNDAVSSAGFILVEFARTMREDMDPQTFETLVMMLGLTNDQVLELRRNFIQNGEAVVESDQKLRHIIGVLDSYVGVADPAVLATRRFQQSQKDAAGATRDYTDALQAQRDLIKEMTDPVFALLAANDRFEDAQRRLNEAAAEGSITSEEYQDALGDVLRATLDLNQAQADANMVGLEGLDLLEQIAIQAGINTRAFDLWRAAVDLLAGSIARLPATVGGRPTVTSGGGGSKGTGDLQQFATGGIVQGPAGSPQLIVAHAGEMVIPAQSAFALGGIAIGSTTYVGGSTVVVQSPMNDFRTDLQYATLLASVTNLVEGS